MNAILNKSFTDKIIDGLKSAVNEIEDLRVQGSLAAAEARDQFEGLKKKFNAQISELKNAVEVFRSDEAMLKVINSIEFLQVQLALGASETKDEFEYQRKRILVALRSLEKSISDLVDEDEQYAFLQFEIEKFKIKIDLLALHFQLKKITLQYNFEQRKYAFITKLREIKLRLSSGENRKKLQSFRDEVKEAFSELKKAIV